MSKAKALDLSRPKPPDFYEALVLLDSEGQIVQMNLSAEELTGYLASELQGCSFRQIIREASAGKEKHVKARGVEYFLKKKEAGEIPVSLRFSPLMESGGIQLAFIRSLAEEEEHQTTLQSQQVKLNALLEAIPDSIFIQDFQGKFLDYYPPVEGSMFPPDVRVQGSGISDLFPGAVCELLLGAFEEIKTHHKPQHVEFKLGNEPEAYYEARLVPMNNHMILSIIREVTHSRSVQRILNLRNKALEAAGNGIVISDARLADQPIIYVNPAFTEITGYQASEVTGKNCRFLQGSDRDQKGLENIRKALKNQEACREVIRNYRKDGTLFHNELTITPIFDTKGTASHYIGVINDISKTVLDSERKDRIREILQNISEDRPIPDIGKKLCKHLVNQMGGGAALISVLDDSDEYLQALASHGLPDPIEKDLASLDLAESTRCPCEEAAKMKKEKIVPDLQANPDWKERAAALKANGFQACWSFPIRSMEKEILGTCTLFRYRSGRPGKELKAMIREAMQLTGVAIERHQIRKRLVHSNAQLEDYAHTLEQRVALRTSELEATMQKLLQTNQSLVEQIETTQKAEGRATANQALFAAIARNFPRGLIMVFNAVSQLVNLDGEDLGILDLDSWAFEGKTLEELPIFSTAEKENLSDKVSQTLEGSHLSFEISHGTENYMVNSTPLRRQGRDKWALLVFSNSTKQKQTEKELMRALQIEQELNDLKSRFISMASHEFRTPLSAILSSAILIEKQNDPEKEEKRKRYVRQIKNNVRNLVVILDDFLSLSKLEEGNLACQPSEFDLIDLLRTVLEELETNLKVGQHFVEDCERTNFKIYQDRKFTRQILVNLISNALKYSSENHAILIGVRKQGDRVILSVKDEGIGIPQEEQSQLFNRFFRARNAENIAGTGLGLHIVKQYTEIMGGQIRFESKLGVGSTFYVELPLRFNTIEHETNSHH